MGPFFVVTLQPFRTNVSNLVQRLEHIGIQHFRAIGPIESFDEGVLIRFPWLDISQLNRPLGTPGHEPFGNQFRAIVEPNGLRLASPSHDLLEYAHHSFGRQRCIHFDGQPFSHAFVQDIQGAKPSASVEGVAHEIHGRYDIRLRDDHERLAEAVREPLLRPPWQVQPELSVHAPQPLVIPAMSVEPESVTTLPEAPATLRGHEGREGGNHRRIAPGPVHEGPVVRRPAHSYCGTGPLSRKAALKNHVGHDLPPLGGP
jgi:hypothetical protein